MKRLFLIFLLVPLIASGGSSDKRLIGHWQYKDARSSADMTFWPDGKFTNVTSITGIVRSTNSKGRWWVKGNVLQYEYVSDSAGRIAAGTRDQDELIEVAKDHFTIRTQHGAVRTYRRIS